MERPGVSVVVPFYGGVDEAGDVVARLRRIARRAGDELIVADNTGRGVVAEAIAAAGAEGEVTAADAPLHPSSFYARNVGAEVASNDWILFIDADCVPPPGVIDAYFSGPVPDDWGAIAGEVRPTAPRGNLIVRYQRSRRHLSQDVLMEHPHRPMVVTANLLVRRAAWRDLGGFHEWLRSGGDPDFAWRLPDHGWQVGYRAEAWVEHEFTDSVRALARRFARYGAGVAWARRRFPEYPGLDLAGQLPRAVAGAVAWPLLGRPERGAFKALDGVVLVAGAVGWFMGNVSAGGPTNAAPPAGEPTRFVALVDVYPELSETFIHGELMRLMRAGHGVRVEAGARAPRPAWLDVRGLPVNVWEDDGVARKALDLAWLVTRHPLACARDLWAGRRWRRSEWVWPLRSLAPVARRLERSGERHVHAYFLSGAALNAMRLSRLLGITHSVTAYAYEVWRLPRNLPDKLGEAAFVATVSEEGVDEFAKIVPHQADRIHLVGMGVDAARFTRSRPYPGGRRVLAVGRLVEKKGFDDLVAACATLNGALDELVILGDGPLRAALEARAGGSVRFLGARPHEEIATWLEQADVVAVPCVVAADGDRDSLPNVVAEALAMEVPVVTTDVGGMSELVRPGWGRIVPERDPQALAAALTELLTLPAAERARMGREGREFILSVRGAETEASKLARLVAAAKSGNR